MRKESPITKENKRLKGLYIHIPFCLKKCSYCSFFSVPTKSEETVDAVIDAIVKEAEERAKPLIAPPYTLYIGGGTPTAIGERLLKLIERILKILDHLPIEFTVEANPATFSKNLLKGLKALGANRISIGVQSLNDRTLKLLGRAHTKEEALKAVDTALEVFENVNADIIFGVPYQKEKEVEETLKLLVEKGLTHISAYGLSIEEGTRLERWVKEGKIKPVSDEAWSRMFNMVHDILTSEGFVHYEISNYSLPKKACLHNLIYWTRRNYIGLGPSAASLWNNKREKNPSSIEAYLKNPKRETEVLSQKQELEELVMLYLRTERGLCLSKLPSTYREKLLEKALLLKKEGLIRIHKNRISTPHHYWPISNSITASLL